MEIRRKLGASSVLGTKGVRRHSNILGCRNNIAIKHDLLGGLTGGKYNILELNLEVNF